MRQLTAKQKKMLDKWYNHQKAEGKEFGLRWDVDEDDNFSGELYQEIQNINPCEILNQNINHYIHDKSMAELNA